MARRILGISLPNRRLWSGGRSNRDGNFENASKPIGRPVSDGPMNNSTLRRPKKGALHGPGKRDLPGNRNALRSSGGGGTGFRGPGDGGATPSFATRRPCSGTTAERRHQRSCRAATALFLRRPGRLSWPPQQELLKRVG